MLKNFEINPYKRSSKSSWKIYIMKNYADFKFFCTQINLFLNSTFLELSQVLSYITGFAQWLTHRKHIIILVITSLVISMYSSMSVRKKKKTTVVCSCLSCYSSHYKIRETSGFSCVSGNLALLIPFIWMLPKQCFKNYLWLNIIDTFRKHAEKLLEKVN